MQLMDRGDAARRIRAQLGHPVIDADGHWLEPGELFLDYVREIGGEKAMAAMHAHWEGIDAWYRATPSQRVAQRMVRPGWWVEPTDTYDRATAMLPGLMRKRLDDLGIDVGIIYPSIGLLLPGVADAEHRRTAVLAYNTMTADQFRGHFQVFRPAAVLVDADRLVDVRKVAVEHRLQHVRLDPFRGLALHRLELAQAVATAWRVGVIRLGVVPSSRR